MLKFLKLMNGTKKKEAIHQNLKNSVKLKLAMDLMEGLQINKLEISTLTSQLHIKRKRGPLPQSDIISIETVPMQN